MFLDNKYKAGIISLHLLLAVSANAETDSLEQRVLDLEISSLMKKISFSGELRTQGSYNKIEGLLVEGKNHEDKSFFGGLDINATAKVSNTISVYTTLQGNYAYGENIIGRNVDYTSKTDQLSGDDLMISRAFFDWEIAPKRLFISIGRLSTVHGPPQHLYSNTERLGTYPLLAYSIPMDGLALTYNITDPSNRNTSHKLRAAYGPQSNPGADSNVGEVQGERISKTSDLYTFIYEFSKKKWGRAHFPVHFIGQVYGGSLVNERTVEVQGLLGGNNVYEVYGTNDTMTDLKAANAYLEVNDPFNIPIDIYGSYSRNWVKKKGDMIAEVKHEGTNDLTLTKGYKHNLGGFLYDDDASGTRYLLGGRYKGETWAVGGEYFNSSFGTVDSTAQTKRITSFYETIGQGVHLYATKVITPNAADVRIGVSRQLYTHEFKDFTFQDSNRRQDNIYTMMTVRF